jgi:hypothetical protein
MADIAQSQQQSREDVGLAAFAVEVEAAEIESANSQGPLQGEVIWIVTHSIFAHVERLLSNFPSDV